MKEKNGSIYALFLGLINKQASQLGCKNERLGETLKKKNVFLPSSSPLKDRFEEKCFFSFVFSHFFVLLSEHLIRVKEFESKK